MEIIKYFEGDKVKEALERYERFAEERGWSLSHKLELYRAGNIAFSSSYSEDKRRENFETIYNSLKGYWGIFRPFTKGKVWESPKVFDVLTKNCGACSRDSILSLVNLKDEQSKAAISECLAKVKGIKSLKDDRFPTMAVSKFLHFFNPKLFPIYDNKVIKDKVLRIFKNDWSDWKNSHAHIEPDYFKYILWANYIIQQNHRGLMSEFVKWFAEQVEQKRNPGDLKNYYATAFEFIAIGASLIEEGNGT